MRRPMVSTLSGAGLARGLRYLIASGLDVAKAWMFAMEIAEPACFLINSKGRTSPPCVPTITAVGFL